MLGQAKSRAAPGKPRAYLARLLVQDIAAVIQRLDDARLEHVHDALPKATGGVGEEVSAMHGEIQRRRLSKYACPTAIIRGFTRTSSRSTAAWSLE